MLRRNGFSSLMPLSSMSFRDVRSKKLAERRLEEARRVGTPVVFDGSGAKLHSVAVSSSLSDPADSRGHEERDKMVAILKEQGRRRIARREAFLQWQAGQREKGAAHRLVRQAKTQEKFKKRHYHSQSGRLISLALNREDAASGNPDDITDFSTISGLKGRWLQSTDFLRYSNNQEMKENSIHLTLRRH